MNRVASTTRPLLATTLAAFAFAGLSCAESAAAAYDYGTVGFNYLESFDALPSAGTFTLIGAGPHDLDTTAPLNFGLTGWELIKAAGNANPALFAFGTGSSTTAGVSSFGVAGANPLSDRAFGLLASGTNISNIGLVLTNTTGSTLNEIVISFDGEQWRNGGNTSAQSVSFSYGVGLANVSASVLTAVPALNFTSVINTATAGALDGNVTANRTAGITATIGSLNWTSGSTLVLQWNDTNDGGNDHGLAIDNFSFTANLGTVAQNLIWNVGSGTWDTTTANWTGEATVFTAGDNVTFDSVFGGVVTLPAGGVAPHNVVVSATGGTFTFQNTLGDTVGIGGGGTASLAKSGAGTLILTSPNTYGGGTTVTDGTLEISDNNQLGAATGALVLDGLSTLAMTAPVTTARVLTVGSGGAVLATNGHSFVQNGTTALNGVLAVFGAGAAQFNAAVNFSSTGALEIASGSSVTLSVGSNTMNMSAGGVFDGDLILSSTALLRFNGASQTYGGLGKIKILGSAIGAGSAGAAISGGGFANFNFLLTGFETGTVTSEIVLNPAGTGHAAWVPGDVTTPTYTTGSFLAFIGPTGGTLTLDKKITGEGDLFIGGTSRFGGGSGTLVLNAASDYTGNTLINTSAVIQLGVTNALPSATHVVFNSLSSAALAATVDLNGFDLQVASLSNEANGTPSLLTFINLNGTTPAVLTVSGTVTPAHGFGGALMDGANTLALVKAGANKLTLTGTNTYTGGTTVNGGILQAGSTASLPGYNAPAQVSVASGAMLAVNVGGAGQWTDGDIDALRGNVTFAGIPSIGIDASDATGASEYVSSLTASFDLTKFGANTLTLDHAATAATVHALTASGGLTEVGAALGTGTSTVNANADVTFTASQTLDALNIGAGATVTLTDGTPFAALGGKALAAVPEPGSLGLLALGALGLLGRRRRGR